MNYLNLVEYIIYVHNFTCEKKINTLNTRPVSDISQYQYVWEPIFAFFIYKKKNRSL